MVIPVGTASDSYFCRCVRVDLRTNPVRSASEADSSSSISMLTDWTSSASVLIFSLESAAAAALDDFFPLSGVCCCFPLACGFVGGFFPDTFTADEAESLPCLPCCAILSLSAIRIPPFFPPSHKSQSDPDPEPDSYSLSLSFELPELSLSLSRSLSTGLSPFMVFGLTTIGALVFDTDTCASSRCCFCLEATAAAAAAAAAVPERVGIWKSSSLDGDGDHGSLWLSLSLSLFLSFEIVLGFELFFLDSEPVLGVSMSLDLSVTLVSFTTTISSLRLIPCILFLLSTSTWCFALLLTPLHSLYSFPLLSIRNASVFKPSLTV
mmetsp:Transcript_4059/g.7394  ORF Transcript_4059/g.7394 Transcript_4059/m.7394 type:complete len:322 (+) Transcript_4059:1147-2112(+)